MPDDPNKGAAGATTTVVSLADAQRLLKREGGTGDASRVVLKLMRENYKVRERARVAETKVTELDGAKPKDGSVVLDGDQAKAWKALVELKLTPEQLSALPTTVKEHGEMKGKLAGLDHAERMGKIATAAGFDPKVLGDLTTQHGLHVELREVTVKDETTGNSEVQALPHFRKASDANAPLERLDTAAAEKLFGKTYLRALIPEPDAGTEGSSEAAGTQGTAGGSDRTPAPGVQWPRQTGGQGRAQTKPGDAVLERINSRFVPPSKRNATTTTK